MALFETGKPGICGMWMLLVSLACWPALRDAGAGQPATKAEIEKALDDLIESGKCDLRVVMPIHRLPREERPALAKKLAQCPHPAMRQQAVMILQSYPPSVAADTLRKFLNDESPSSRNWAARYLAEKLDDQNARAMLLKNALSKDVETATGALQAIGALKGPDVNEVILQLLQNKDTPKPMRLAAFTAAAAARAYECTPTLVGFLDRREGCGGHRGDKMRVCDLAASALESMHWINYTGIRGVYHSAPLEKRDEGVALWKKWYATHEARPYEEWRELYVGQLIEATLKALEDDPDEATRAVLRERLLGGLRASHCLGELPGVDAIVGPCLRDAWRLRRVYGESVWSRALKPWSGLWYAARAKFFPAAKKSAGDPDRQASEFIVFAQAHSRFPRLQLWTLCRNFAEAFPASKLLPKVNAIKSEAETGFREQRQQVVVHGHIAVLEPMPKPPPVRPGAVLVYNQYLFQKVSEEPSNWERYRVAVDYVAQKGKNAGRVGSVATLFPNKIARYPGNEWPFLGNAIYQLRVKRDFGRALEFADKALVLDPNNAKAYAIRGIIRAASGQSEDAALEDLKQAFKRAPKALGDEPETPQAIAFLIQKTREAGDDAQARAYATALKQLRPLKVEHPIKEYRTLMDGG